jgi:hypothetical protein
LILACDAKIVCLGTSLSINPSRQIHGWASGALTR